MVACATKKTRAGVRCRPTAHSARAYVSGRQSTFCAVTKKTTAARAAFSNGVPLPKSRERYSSGLWCRATKKTVAASRPKRSPNCRGALRLSSSARHSARAYVTGLKSATERRQGKDELAHSVKEYRSQKTGSGTQVTLRQDANKKKPRTPRASALPKSRERTGCAENRGTGKAPR